MDINSGRRAKLPVARILRRRVVRSFRSALCTMVVLLLPWQAFSAPVAEFPFQYREGLLWVDVRLRQALVPLHFLLDTGASASAIDRDTAKWLGLKRGDEVPVRGVQTALTGHWEENVEAWLGSVPLPKRILAIDLGQLSRSCQMPVQGLVGADFLNSRAVQIDFEAHKIRLLPPEECEASSHDLPLRIRPNGWCVPVSINDHEPQWLRLDTGCAGAVHWVTKETDSGRAAPQLAMGLAQVSIPQATTKVSLGGLVFNNIPTGLHRRPIFPNEAGLLGNELLSRFSKVTIDTLNKRVNLEPR